MGSVFASLIASATPAGASLYWKGLISKKKERSKGVAQKG